MTIHLTVHGKGMPLVLFHGWGFDSQIWHPILPGLTETHQLYLVDLPGFGFTELMTWGAFKTELLKHLPERFALLGWSMGGLFATKLALEAEARVSHLINLTTSPCFIRKEQWPGIDYQIFNSFYQTLLFDPGRTLQQFIQLQLQGHPLSSLPFVGKGVCLDGLRAGLEQLLEVDLRKDLVSLKMPVSYLFGRYDAIVTVRLMKTMQNVYPQFEYVLFPHAAHAPFLSHVDEFVATLKRILQ